MIALLVVHQNFLKSFTNLKKRNRSSSNESVFRREELGLLNTSLHIRTIMTTSAAKTTPSPFRRSGWLLASIAVVNLPIPSSSFTVPQPQCSTIHKTASRPLRREGMALCSTAHDEEQLLASVEDGTLDIEALEEMFGEEFDFDDVEEDEDDAFDDDEEDDEDEDADYDDEIDSGDFDEEDEESYEEYDEEDYDDDEEIDYDEEEVGEVEENETELVMKFAEECLETEVGDLDASDAELIREILGNIPVDAASLHETDDAVSSSNKKASYAVESLFHRFIDEWKDVSVLLAIEEDSDIPLEELKEREQIFRPIAIDFHNIAVAMWRDEQNNDTSDMKAARIWKLFAEQRELISCFTDEDPLAAEALYPTYRSIEILLESLSLSSDRGVGRKAFEIVEKWLPEYGLTPSPGMYAPYIQMIAKARNRGAARKAESILRKALAEYPPSKFESPIGVEVFNTVVTAYAKARGEGDGPKGAQDLIVFMDSLDAPGCAPNAKTFTSLVDAYAQTNEWDGVTEAQSILNNLLNQYLLQEGEGKHLEPSVATWTIVIAAWMRLSKKGRKGAAKRAGDLLRRMDSLSSSGRITAKPDAITYVTVFNAYAYSKMQDEVEEAEVLLDEMNELYLDGDDSFKPSVRSIKVLMDAWIKIGAIDRAEQVLKTYEDILEEAEDSNDSELRHTMSAEDWQDIYKSLLIGYCRLGNPKRATAYLKLMVENEGMEPDSMCYERVIDAFVRLGEEDSGKKTQEIFQLLENRRKAGAVKPNERVFTGFIRALTKSKVSGLFKKADLMLQRMHNLSEAGNPDIEPTIFTYNAVLNACAESASIDGTPLQEAFETSVRIFTQLRKEMEPDHVTFANMIRCGNLLPPVSSEQTKEKFLTATFKLCCKSGDVNNYLIRDLSRVASKDVWESLTGFSAASEDEVEVDIEVASMMVEQLPTSWKRKALERQKPPGSRRQENNYR